MLKVASCLLQAQLPFFEEGPARLRPMVLQDVADAVGMHVSTISRVSNGKYMQTPHGVFELKYFFDNKLSTDAGEDVSVRSVKEKISQLVAEEDKVRPLSDQQIVEELSKGGLQIARRTGGQIPRSAKNFFSALPQGAVGASSYALPSFRPTINKCAGIFSSHCSSSICSPYSTTSTMRQPPSIAACT